jgi:hypothetical protein
LGFRGRLSPNGPPSPRLAPGGFYARTRAECGFARGEPVPIERRWETERSQDGEARFPTSEAEGRMPKASVREMARAHPEPE